METHEPFVGQMLANCSTHLASVAGTGNVEASGLGVPFHVKHT